MTMRVPLNCLRLAPTIARQTLRLRLREAGLSVKPSVEDDEED